jgi:SAM-dependent methyltransferase
MKIQFASGGNQLDGWLNLQEHDGDITKPLAFKNDSVDFIFIEHGLEHVTPQQGYKFLLEAYRILKSGGVIRVIVPDISEIWAECSLDYLSMLKEGRKTWWPAANWKPVPSDDCNPSSEDAVETLIFCHGHQAVYTSELLIVLIDTAGLGAQRCEYGKSDHPELNGIDSHWKYMGLENCILESCVVEGTKP